MDWTEDMIARIRDLWAEGHSTAEIGRRMGVTKNAIVGKAHRLALPPRPSPIRKMADGASRQRPPRPEIPRPTNFPAREQSGFAPRSPHAFAPRPLFPAAPPSAEAGGQAVPAARPGPAPVGPPPAPERPAFRAFETPARSGPRVQPCCWPIGEPGTPEFRFCGADAATGRPYCTEHVQVAYVKVRDRREDAA